jgi:NADPH2:quinone reductase
MKSYIVNEFGPPESLAFEDRPIPEPGTNQLVVDVKAIGLNFPDNLLISGQYQKLPERPFTPGMEFSGVVRSVGAGVTSFQAGDRVIAQPGKGGFTQHAIAEPHQTFKLADGMDFESASAMGLAFQAAYIALHERGGFTSGDVVLVGGANGGVGFAAVQIAKALGGTVLAGARTEAAARIAREAGADHIIDLAADNLKDSLRDQVMAASGNHGADIVIDPVGGEFLHAAMRAMAWCGRLVVVGFAAGEIPQIKANYLLVKNITVSGMQWTDYRDRKPDVVQAAHDRMNQLWAAGLLKPLIGRTYPFEQLPAALARLKTASPDGRIIIKL